MVCTVHQDKPEHGRYALVGIVSYGKGCGEDTAGVYTRVSGYQRWIESNIGRNVDTLTGLEPPFKLNSVPRTEVYIIKKDEKKAFFPFFLW